eukprot:2968661-Amphidinium_carterae.1
MSLTRAGHRTSGRVTREVDAAGIITHWSTVGGELSVLLCGRYVLSSFNGFLEDALECWQGRQSIRLYQRDAAPKLIQVVLQRSASRNGYCILACLVQPWRINGAASNNYLTSS